MAVPGEVAANRPFPNILWPRMAERGTTALAELVREIETTQWLAAAELEVGQRLQLHALAVHAQQHSPFFAGRLQQAGLQPQDLGESGALAALPPLRRRDIQRAGAALACTEVPPRHAPLRLVRTSGSTGEPVAFQRTAVNGLFWLAFTARDNLWHAREYAKPIAYVRARFEKRSRHPNWGLPMSALYRTGPALFAPSTAETGRIWDWINEFEAATLLTHPNTLELLARFAEARGATLPRLSQVWTNGETLTPETRELAERALCVRVADLYSSEEVGVVAIQCPQSDLYHVMAEGLIVEVLDDAGRACEVGGIGRVVVTDLHNHATPIIRYELGDVAEVGGTCPCGRGLPTLKRIFGRERNQMVLPDGRRVWPHLGTARFRSVAPILQYQFIQHDVGRIEARLVTGSGAPLDAEQEQRITQLLQDSLGSALAIEFAYFPEEIPRAANGKFEQFICRVS